MAASNRALDEAIGDGVRVEERSVALEEIRAFLREADNRCVVALLDVSSLRGTSSYTGHFVVLTDLEDVAVFHDPSRFAGPDREISLETFEQARHSWGTDEDMLFVSGSFPQRSDAEGTMG